MNYFKNKVAIVTGASSGIGEAIAVALSEQGCKVVIAARSEAKLQLVAAKIETLGNEVLSVVTDVSQQADCENLVQKTIANFGKIDIVVANAGISMRALFKDVDTRVLENLMQVNFWGVVYCFKAAFPYILASQGHLVAISSIAGVRGLPARTAYSASKGALNLFMESLRTENLYTGVKVNLVCPGYTASNIRKTALNADGAAQEDSPLDESKLMSSEAVAQHTLRAIAKNKKTVYLTGMGKLTVFLQKCFPKMMDKMVYKRVAKEKDSPF
ncbi:MAG: SDR family oxidoreductase [Chitinophagales bacterium]|nr:SDR family oxidoreductase [Bacteroidota bacterium]MCB9042486.1 SDR family oxidoreductase [Chitinophagales bacterium]